MKHYKNLFINQLNTKDVDHFTTDTGLFLRRKTNGAFRKLCNIFTNATIIREDTPDYANDEEYYGNLKPDRIPLSNYPLSTKKNANNIVVERYPKLDKDESYIFVGTHVCPEDIETMLTKSPPPRLREDFLRSFSKRCRHSLPYIFFSSL